MSSVPRIRPAPQWELNKEESRGTEWTTVVCQALCALSLMGTGEKNPTRIPASRSSQARGQRSARGRDGTKGISAHVSLGNALKGLGQEGKKAYAASSLGLPRVPFIHRLQPTFCMLLLPAWHPCRLPCLECPHSHLSAFRLCPSLLWLLCHLPVNSPQWGWRGTQEGTGHLRI